MDNQIQYKAVIKINKAKSTKRIIIPSNLDTSGGKFYVSSVAGRLTTVASSKYIHVQSTNLSTEYIYASETGDCGILGSCVLSDVVSSNILEADTLGIGFPIPSDLSASSTIELQITDSNYNLISDSEIDFIEISIIFICNKISY